MAAAQAGKSVEEVWAHAKMSAGDKHLTETDWREGIVASCPARGAPQETNAKFYPQCGQDLKSGKHCTQCAAKLEPNAGFCAECDAPRRAEAPRSSSGTRPRRGRVARTWLARRLGERIP